MNKPILKSIFDVGEYLLFILMIGITVDFFAFCMWWFSGQMPLGNFYLGSVSAHIFGFIIKFFIQL